MEGGGDFKNPVPISKLGGQDMCASILKYWKTRVSFMGKPVGSRFYYKSSFSIPLAIERINANELGILVPRGDSYNKTGTAYKQHPNPICKIRYDEDAAYLKRKDKVHMDGKWPTWYKPLPISKLGGRDTCASILSNSTTKALFTNKPIGYRVYYTSSYKQPVAIEKTQGGLRILVPPKEGGNSSTGYEEHKHHTCHVKYECPPGMKPIGDGSACTKKTGGSRQNCALDGNSGMIRCYCPPKLKYGDGSACIPRGGGQKCRLYGNPGMPDCT
jgi:hypothetical protein